MSAAVPGHGVTIAAELLPASAQGTFTAIGELNGDISWPGLMRTATEVTPHDENIDSYVTGVLRRDPLTFSVNFIFNNGGHDHLTGLQDAIISKEKRGYRMRGPGGSANTDEWIMSGEVISVKPVSPVREGARTAEVTIQMSGPMIVDGVVIGA